MTTKRFDIDDMEYTVTVSHFNPGAPAKISGPPEDCYPEEPWEIEFDPMVDVEDPEGNTAQIDFDEFIERYASMFFENDERKALEKVESETYERLMDRDWHY